MKLLLPGGGFAAALLVCAFGWAGESPAKRAVTVAESIQTTRFKSDAGGKRVAFVSADGSRYAVALIRGDLAQNLVRMELRVGGMHSLAAAADLKAVAQLSTTGKGSLYGRSDELTWDFSNPLEWLDGGERIAMLWGNDAGPTSIQAVAVDVRTGSVDKLTQHPTDVFAFAVHRDGTIVYAADAQREDRSAELMRTGFTLTNPDAISLINGDVDGWGWDDHRFNFEWFVRRPGGEAQKLSLQGREFEHVFLPTPPVLSPSGRQALVVGDPTPAPGWEKYTSYTRDIRELIAGATPRALRQLFLVDLERRTSRAVWNAPHSVYTRAAWSPDERFLLLGPTFVPTEQADRFGLDARAVVILELATGRIASVPMPERMERKGIDHLRWLSASTIEIGNSNELLRLRKKGGQWRAEAASKAALRIELRQDATTPPQLYAVDGTSGQERMILDPNPELLNAFMLGRIEAVQWKDDVGRVWKGRLYHPVDDVPSRRVPLVINTHGNPPAHLFSLSGKYGLGPTWGPSASQPLANRGIAVLEVEDKPLQTDSFSPLDAELHQAGYDSAAQHFVANGRALPDKIGIMGYSRTGWFVNYTLTHTVIAYAAAISADGSDASYLQYLVGVPLTDAMNGGAPLGKQLAQWLERAPGFNAHRFNTPLQIQLHMMGVPLAVSQWELFSLLRTQGKPVEMYALPDFAHGSHGLQNPAQCLAAQQRTVDWFDFWLNGHEDADPAKAQQYAQWRRLRDQQAFSSAARAGGTANEVEAN